MSKHWRNMTGAERYNYRKDKIFDAAYAQARAEGRSSPWEKTTADYRKLAMEHESRLEWGAAADAWQAAIEAYPPRSKIGERDLELMEQRRRDCLSAYFPS